MRNDALINLELRNLILHQRVLIRVVPVQQVVAGAVLKVEVVQTALVNEQLAQDDSVHFPHEGEEEQDGLNRDIPQNSSHFPPHNRTESFLLKHNLLHRVWSDGAGDVVAKHGVPPPAGTVGPILLPLLGPHVVAS